MENWLLTMSATTTLLYFLSRIAIYIDIRYQFKNDDDNILVCVNVFRRFTLYRMRVPVIQFSKHMWVQSKVETANNGVETRIRREKRFAQNAAKIYLTQPRRLLKLLQSYHFYLNIYKKFFNEILTALRCEKLYLKAIYGSDDASITGNIIAFFWAINSLVLTKLKKRITFINRPQIVAIPSFGEKKVEVDFQCIFSIRLGNIISATGSALIFKSKGVTGSG